jgi:hypothetical protein
VQYFAFRVFVIGLAILMIEERAVDAQEPARLVLLLYPYDNVNPVTLTVGTAIQGFCRRTLSEGRHPFGFYRSCPLSPRSQSARVRKKWLTAAGFGWHHHGIVFRVELPFHESGTVSCFS